MATKKTDKTLEQGPIWVAASGPTWQETPTLDADEILKLRENYYWASVREALKTLVYRERYTLEVLGPDLNPDEEKTTALTHMADRVALWDKTCTILPDWVDWGLAPWNDVWGGTGTPADPYELKQVRRVDPYSLRRKPMAAGLRNVHCEVLPGICYNPTTGEVEIWATDDTGYTTQRLTNVTLLTDPTSTELGGTPMIKPAAAVIRMLDFSWGAQMQKINRIGAPSVAIRMEKWTDEDVAYAQKVAANWGKDTTYIPRPGMEIVPLNFTDTKSAETTIGMLAGMVVDFFSPAKMISKSGTLIGGSAAPELEMTYAFIAGIHRRIESNLERLLQPWCDLNGWPEYTVKVHIPSPAIDRAELNLKLATELRASGLADPPRYLALLGEDGYSREEIEEHAAWWAEHGTPAPAPLGFANITNAREADAFDHHEAIVDRTLLAFDAELAKLKKGVAGLVEGD